eukprot:scaffold236942_cov17-Prasinocladus_malaysianus.AAC.1
MASCFPCSTPTTFGICWSVKQHQYRMSVGTCLSCFLVSSENFVTSADTLIWYALCLAWLLTVQFEPLEFCYIVFAAHLTL